VLQLIHRKSHIFEERTLRILLSAGTSGGARMLGVLFTLLITPMVYRAVGAEQFGLWSITQQLITFTAFADFGLGNGLLTRLNHTSDKREQESYIASAFFLLVCIALALLLFSEISLSVYRHYWAAHLNPSNDSVPIVRTFALIFCFILPFSIIQKIQFSNFDNVVFHAWEIFDKSLGVIGVFLAVTLRAELYIMFTAFYAPTLLANFLNFISYKKGLIKKAALSRQHISRTKVSDLFMIGRSFFILTLMFSLSRATDGMLLASIADFSTVSVYQLPLRLFDLILVVTMLFSSPLWSGYANAFNCNDVPWIKKTLIYSLCASGLFCVAAGGLLAVFGNEILGIWTRTQISNLPLMYFGLFAWTLVSALVNVLSAYLNARAKIRGQLLMFSAFLLCGVPLKILGYRIGDVTGFILVNTIAQIFCILVPSIAIVYKDYLLFKRETSIKCSFQAL